MKFPMMLALLTISSGLLGDPRHLEWPHPHNPYLGIKIHGAFVTKEVAARACGLPGQKTGFLGDIKEIRPYRLRYGLPHRLWVARGQGGDSVDLFDLRQNKVVAPDQKPHPAFCLMVKQKAVNLHSKQAQKDRRALVRSVMGRSVGNGEFYCRYMASQPIKAGQAVKGAAGGRILQDFYHLKGQWCHEPFDECLKSCNPKEEAAQGCAMKAAQTISYLQRLQKNQAHLFSMIRTSMRKRCPKP